MSVACAVVCAGAIALPALSSHPDAHVRDLDGTSDVAVTDTTAGASTDPQEVPTSTTSETSASSAPLTDSATATATVSTPTGAVTVTPTDTFTTPDTVTTSETVAPTMTTLPSETPPSLVTVPSVSVSPIGSLGPSSVGMSAIPSVSSDVIRAGPETVAVRVLGERIRADDQRPPVPLPPAAASGDDTREPSAPLALAPSGRRPSAAPSTLASTPNSSVAPPPERYGINADAETAEVVRIHLEVARGPVTLFGSIVLAGLGIAWLGAMTTGTGTHRKV